MATVPSEITYTPGAILTASQLNTNLRDGVNFVINRPVCQCRQTAAQSLTSGSAAALLLDTEDIDNDGMHSTTTNTSRFTAVTAGRYQLGGGYCAASGSGRREVWYRINGVDVSGTESGLFGSTNNTGPASRAVSVFLNVGDYAELFAYQDSGGAILTIVTGSMQPSFYAHWIGTT